MAEYSGHQTKLEVQLGAVWTTVAQIVDLDGPAAEADQIEVSHRDVTNFFRAYVAGMRDGGEVTFNVIFDPDHASHDPSLSDSMWGYLENGTSSSFRITFPGSGTATTRATFTAFVSGFEITSPMEDAQEADITLKISGSITWAHIP